MRFHASQLIIFFVFVTNFGYAASSLNRGENRGEISNLTVQAEALLKSRNQSPPKTEDEVNSLLKSAKKQINQRGIYTGGVDTGGSGTLVTVDGHTGLLDLYLNNKAAFYDKTPGNENVIELKQWNSENLEYHPVFAKTLAQISKWNESSPIITGDLLRLERLMRFAKFTTKRFQLTPKEYAVPASANIQPSQLKVVAMAFNEPGVGIYISYDLFRSLSEKNQVAVIIHEMLRLLNQVSRYSLNNSQLQNLTATLIRDPATNETLDTAAYLGINAHGKILYQYGLYKRMQLLAIDACSPSYKPLDSSVCLFVYQDMSLADYLTSFRSLQSDYFASMKDAKTVATWELLRRTTDQIYKEIFEFEHNWFSPSQQ